MKKSRSKKRKLVFSFNNLNRKNNFNTLSSLKTKKYNKFINRDNRKESINNNYKTIDVNPYISQTYYKDPFFLNEFNLKTQIHILRSIDKEKINNNNDTNNKNIETQTLPNIDDFKSNTFNYFKNNPLKSDDFYYKSVFKMKPLFRKIRPVVDNKLNMRYSENEEQYKKIIEKEQKILLAKGKKIKNKNISEHINIKMDDIKKRIRFMKGIIDFSYPGFVLAKIKAIDKELKKQNEYKQKLHEYHSPVESRNLRKEIRNNERKDYLFECININNNLK